MKDFLVFLIQTPRVTLMTLGVAVAQILKYAGVKIDDKSIDGLMDAISVVFGFIGLYFAAKGKWTGTLQK